MLLLLWRDQATTVFAMGVLLLMLFAMLCTPMINQKFTHERFATIGATGGDELSIAV
jgi:hypothetical protein